MEYKIGDIVRCKVTGIEKYGFFVRIDETTDGLVHISEVSNNFVRNINDFVKVGEEISAKIIDTTEISNHLKLSIKNLDYRNEEVLSKIESGAHGFDPLKTQLPIWMEEMLEEIEK